MSSTPFTLLPFGLRLGPGAGYGLAPGIGIGLGLGLGIGLGLGLGLGYGLGLGLGLGHYQQGLESHRSICVTSVHIHIIGSVYVTVGRSHVAGVIRVC